MKLKLFNEELLDLVLKILLSESMIFRISKTKMNSSIIEELSPKII